MIYRLTADFVVLLHLAFILFAAFGGLLVLKYPRGALQKRFDRDHRNATESFDD